MIQNRRHDFGLDSIRKVQLLTQGFFQRLRVHLCFLLPLFLLTHGHPLFLQGRDLAVEACVAFLEFLQSNGICHAQLQQFILLLLDLGDLYLNPPNLSGVVHPTTGGFPNAVQYQPDDLFFLCDHLLKEIGQNLIHFIGTDTR